MSEEGQFKGSHFKMMHGLLAEYNPEIAEEVSKKLSFDVNAIEPEGWYPISDYIEYLKALSPEAQLASTKLITPAILKQVPALREISGPVELFEKISSLPTISYRNMQPDRWEVLELGDDFLKVKIHTAFHEFPHMFEGFIRGVFAQFKIIHVHATVTKEAGNSLLFEFKWE